MAYYADGDDISSNETDRDFERPNTGDFISYEELEDGELLSDDGRFFKTISLTYFFRFHFR